MVFMKMRVATLPERSHNLSVADHRSLNSVYRRIALLLHESVNTGLIEEMTALTDEQLLHLAVPVHDWLEAKPLVYLEPQPAIETSTEREI